MRGRGERGTAATEALLVMIPLAVFLVLSPILYFWWSADQMARIDAHRRTFAKAVGYVDSVPADGDPNLLGGRWRSRFRSFQPDPGYQLDISVIGQSSRTVRSTGLLPGTLTFDRRAFLLRPPWTWSGYPFTMTQTEDTLRYKVSPTVNETADVRSWFGDMDTIPGLVKEGVTRTHSNGWPAIWGLYIDQ